ncbi:MAG: undecaprenyl/decaprenyl-phosphate alpha-N-acetylglucosaminyl 1-phosphate transferase [Atopobiaceae bacterium]|nr:undecaprenyl/decaprenyl-phosphate alpha-N-acetylglucosaminyl 1-phosphate transferase [Atopobiaceae bacterium]
MVEWWAPFITLFVCSMTIALLTTPLARRVAWRVGAVDKPSARRINCHPIPRMGGIAIFLAIFGGILIESLLGHAFGWPRLLMEEGPFGNRYDYPRIGLGVFLIFLTGLIDDLVTLTPKQKLLGQILGTCVTVSGGLTIDVIVNPLSNDGIDLGWLTFPITVVYLVAYTNIFNLIDGLDGLAAGIACIASVTMWVVSTMAGRLDAAALSLVLAGATLGFLRYNFNPASIFMGDSGSLLIGFVLGSISLMSVQRIAGLTSIIIPLVIAGIPIIDTFSAIVRRGRAHVSIGQADKGHIHHRLMEEGFNQRQTVLFIYAWTTVLCMGSILMTQVTVLPRIAIFCILIASSIIFAMRLHLFQPVLLHHYNPETGADELVAPQDPAFAEEAQKFEEEHPLF